MGMALNSCDRNTVCLQPELFTAGDFVDFRNHKSDVKEF